MCPFQYALALTAALPEPPGQGSAPQGNHKVCWLHSPRSRREWSQRSRDCRSWAVSVEKRYHLKQSGSSLPHACGDF